MTFEIGLLLFIVAVALALFAFEWVPADVVALGILLVLILTGLLPADKAFAGFGSETVLMLLGLLILTAALVETGVVELAGRFILRRAAASPNQVLAVVMVAGLTLSSFMSNTAATAFLLPVVSGVAANMRLSPSRLLMPLAFATILASSVTLIATSTNIVVSGMLVQHQMAPIGLFELTPVGIPIALVGVALHAGSWPPAHARQARDPHADRRVPTPALHHRNTCPPQLAPGRKDTRTIGAGPRARGDRAGRRA